MASAEERFRHGRNEGFVCEHCGTEVKPLANRSYRNHCPACLWSKHVDHVPGDHASPCGGLMEPLGVEQDARRGWMIVHRCRRCRAIRRNQAAVYDRVQPDRIEALIDLAQRQR